MTTKRAVVSEVEAEFAILRSGCEEILASLESFWAEFVAPFDLRLVVKCGQEVVVEERSGEATRWTLSEDELADGQREDDRGATSEYEVRKQKGFIVAVDSDSAVLWSVTCGDVLIPRDGCPFLGANQIMTDRMLTCDWLEFDAIRRQNKERKCDWLASRAAQLDSGPFQVAIDNAHCSFFTTTRAILGTVRPQNYSSAWSPDLGDIVFNGNVFGDKQMAELKPGMEVHVEVFLGAKRYPDKTAWMANAFKVTNDRSLCSQNGPVRSGQFAVNRIYPTFGFLSPASAVGHSLSDPVFFCGRDFFGETDKKLTEVTVGTRYFALVVPNLKLSTQRSCADKAIYVGPPLEHMEEPLTKSAAFGSNDQCANRSVPISPSLSDPKLTDSSSE